MGKGDMGARGVVAGEEPGREMEADSGAQADEEVEEEVVVEEEVQIEREEESQQR